MLLHHPDRTTNTQIILIEQSVPMLGLQHVLEHPGGLHDSPATPIEKLVFVVKHLTHANKTTTLLSFASLGLLIALRLVKQFAVKRPGGVWMRYVPEILLVVVGTTGEFHNSAVSLSKDHLSSSVLTGVFRWDLKGVQVLGKVSTGKGIPFGIPLDKLQWKYFSYTVSLTGVGSTNLSLVPHCIRHCYRGHRRLDRCRSRKRR